MSPQMIQKQIYIPKRQQILLKQLAQAQGISESELIRQAIEREIFGEINQTIKTDPNTAWQEIISLCYEAAPSCWRRKTPPFVEARRGLC